MGMIMGAAIAHNFGLASSGAGATFNGQVAVVICFIFLWIISYSNSEISVKNNKGWIMWIK